MRIVLVCTALCVSFPIQASADLRNSTELAPQQASFAYRAQHAPAAAPSTEPALPSEPFGVAGRATVSFPSDQNSPRAFSKGELCVTAASVAEANNLPVPFFTNLIQQESGFKPHVVSPAGAQGIAQFMPRVAASYGLVNPFDPIQALAVSGKFLAELVAQFGNLGLAAAAYNAGPKRVQNWMARRGKLPAETRQYVQNITGRPAEQWTRRARSAAVKLPARTSCPDTRTMEARAPERSSVPPLARKMALATTNPRVTRKPSPVAAELPAKRALALASSSSTVPRKIADRVQPSAPIRIAKLAPSKNKPTVASAKPSRKIAVNKSGTSVALKRVRVAAAR